MNLVNFFGMSRTLSLATTIVGLLSVAFKKGEADEWVFEHLPEHLKKDATLEEFKSILETGKSFIKACYNFFHS